MIPYLTEGNYAVDTCEPKDGRILRERARHYREQKRRLLVRDDQRGYVEESEGDPVNATG